MILELHSTDYRKPKKAYYVEFFDLEKDEEEPIVEWISLQTLSQYVTVNELNVISNYPVIGDSLVIDLLTWIEENETFVIKHYLDSKYSST